MTGGGAGGPAGDRRVEPFAARLHVIPRIIIKPVQTALVRMFRRYFEQAPGWVVMTTTGRRSGFPREVLLPCERWAEGMLVISTYGNRSDWMRNIRRNPRVLVTCAGWMVAAEAEIVEELDAKRALVDAHPFCAPAPFGLINFLHRTLLRPLTCAFLRWWVNNRPVVVIRPQRAAAPTEAKTALQDGRPSVTAQRAALLRAAHQVLDHPPILDDPLALRLIDPAGAEALRTGTARLQAPALKALRVSIALRSRYAEDRLAAAFARGVRQYVVLGAGLDTFAYRNPHPDGLRVYEVDHPATQAWKRAQLAEVGIALPPSLTFVPIDFETETLDAALRASGFRTDEPAFFSWLGVTMYLSREAVMQTLRLIAATCAPGSEIVFSYVVSPSQFSEHAALVGEPWRTFFDPPALQADLRRLGFRDIEDLGSEEANARYCAQRADGLRVGGSGHVLAARL